MNKHTFIGENELLKKIANGVVEIGKAVAEQSKDIATNFNP